MTNDEIIVGLPGYQITGIEREKGTVVTSVRYSGPTSCPHCQTGKEAGEFTGAWCGMRTWGSGTAC